MKWKDGCVTFNRAKRSGGKRPRGRPSMCERYRELRSSASIVWITTWRVVLLLTVQSAVKSHGSGVGCYMRNEYSCFALRVYTEV